MSSASLRLGFTRLCKPEANPSCESAKREARSLSDNRRNADKSCEAPALVTPLSVTWLGAISIKASFLNASKLAAAKED